jgi:REP element-mobilizing transposase RayT
MHLVAARGCRTLGYVIMPNHLHLLIHVPEGLSINALLANMKRFAAYEVIKRLEAQGDSKLLDRLASSVSQGGTARNQRHCVWRTSSDIKRCFNEKFVLQKLNYIHANPVRGKWMLAERSMDYPHSSAMFYHSGEERQAPVVHFHEVLFGDRVDSGSLRRP